ncbi:uncharacterized protein LOC115877779 [Sitophilus oryzae]|uniref:Uncharacterized protein LOC115877779 n=1 Tax=Sitophilus oryzae TaxID=7048 RepID=A0A6J2XGV2_SITOR|nr:uncharacterized protein LOC115877779 [Sitophilus oryzae]
MPGHEISEFDRARIIALHEEGLSRHQIADRLNLVRSTVSRIIQRYMDTGNVRSRPRLRPSKGNDSTTGSLLGSICQKKSVSSNSRATISVSTNLPPSDTKPNHFQATF